jgi:TPR repeat protein
MSLILPASPQIHSPSEDEPRVVKAHVYLNTTNTAVFNDPIKTIDVCFEDGKLTTDKKIFERHVLVVEDLSQIPDGPMRSFFEAMSLIVQPGRSPQNTAPQNEQAPKPPHFQILRILRSLKILNELASKQLPEKSYLPIFHTLIGQLYKPGKQPRAAVRFTKLAADQGYAPAQFNLAEMYYCGEGNLPKDLIEAVHLFKLAADQGYAPAQFNLGRMYYYGEGNLPKDLIEAARLYKLAADQGYDPAQNNLGIMYYDGKGNLPKDPIEAVRLYKLAADQGYAPAQFNLGMMYYDGEGNLPKDPIEATRLYKLAADQGDAPAQFNLAEMYYYGEGNLPKDPIEAARLYKLAADQGDAPAQNNLGMMYYDGEGNLPKDPIEAVRLYKLAADQGDAPAQGNLGRMYYYGEGNLPKDPIEAARLYKLAADQGEIEAKFMLEKLSPHQAMPTPKTPETPDQEPPEAPHPAPAPKAPPMSGPAPAYQAAVLSLQDQLKNQGQTISLQRQEILEGQKYEDEMRGLQNSVMTVQENELKRSSNSPDSAAKRLRPDAEANVDKG